MIMMIVGRGNIFTAARSDDVVGMIIMMME